MVFVTGDVHCPIDVHKLNSKNFPIQKSLTKDDYLIVCGDMGIVWSNPEGKGYNEDIYWQKWFDTRNYTTLFVDGNHENHPLLNSFPIVDFCGGKVHKIRDSVYHLIRGEIYTIEGKTFFCFGGASSHDKYIRKEGVDWWPEEIADINEMNKGIENLEKFNNSVDYIITHCCSTPIQKVISPYYESDSMTQIFKFISENVEFKHWFFGHYHVDKEVNDKFTCLYDNIVKIL